MIAIVTMTLTIVAVAVMAVAKKHIIYYNCELDYVKTVCGLYIDIKHACEEYNARQATCKNCKRIHKKYKKWKADLGKIFN